MSRSFYQFGKYRCHKMRSGREAIPIATGIAGAVIGGAIGGPMGAAIGYGLGSMIGTLMFPVKGKGTEMPKMGGYPIQSSCKGNAVPKLYGTTRLAGNVIWLGDQQCIAHEEDVGGGKGGGGGSTTTSYTYRRSFLIALCEGPATVLRAWQNKTEITLDAFTQFSGNNNTGIEALLNADASADVDGAAYKNLCCVFFQNYDLGNTDQLPNFTFEVTSGVAPILTYNFDACRISRFIPDGTLDTNFATGGNYTAPTANYIYEAVKTADGGCIYCHEPQNDTDNDIHCAFIYSSDENIKGELHAGDILKNLADTKTVELIKIFYWRFTNISNYGIAWFRVTRGTNVWDTQLYKDGVAGTSTINLYYDASVQQYSLTKVTKDGVVDTSWANNGHFRTPIDGFTSSKFVVDKLGNVYAHANGVIIKMDKDGQLVCATKGCATVSDLVLSHDHQYLYISMFQQNRKYYDVSNYIDTTLTRLKTSDCLPDDSWSTHGYLMFYNILPYYLYIASMSVDLEGSLFCALNTQKYIGGDDYYSCVKIKSDGNIDTAWGYNGFGGLNWDGQDNNNYIKLGASTACFGQDFYYLADAVSSGVGDSNHNALIKIDLKTGRTVTILKDFYLVYSGIRARCLNVQTGNIIIGFYNTYDFGGGNYYIHSFDMQMNYQMSYRSVIATDDIFISGAYQQNPADVVQDLLTNTRYGAGVSTALVDSPSFQALSDYCAVQGLLFSFLLADKKPVLDWIDYICSHFWGFLVVSGGQIKLCAFRDQDPVATITRDNLVIPDPDSTDPPISVKKRAYKDTCNRVEVSYLNALNTYEVAVAIANDEVDQRQSGKVRTRSVDMRGCSDAALANRLAFRMLLESMYRQSIYSFVLGYKDMLLEPGDVITLSDGFNITNQRVRITSINESKDGKNLDVEAIDEPSEIYEQFDVGAAEGLHVPTEPVTLVAPAINFTEMPTTALLNLHISPNTDKVTGWIIYKSWDDTSYTQLGFASAGKVNSYGTILSPLSAEAASVWKPDDWFDVNIGDYGVLADCSDADFFSGNQACRIGDEIIGFQNAVLLTGNTWRISNLIRGMYNTDAAAHAINAVFATTKINYQIAYTQADVGKTIYIKAVPFYGSQVENIINANSTSYVITGECFKPANVSSVRIDGNPDGVFTYDGNPTIDWQLANKSSGYGANGYGSQLYGAYTPDPNLESVLLRIKDSDGTVINDITLAATAEQKALDFVTDMDSTDPATIEIIPQTSMQSAKVATIEIDRN